MNNMTILNLIVKFTGPIREDNLNRTFIGIQIACSVLAFACRFLVAKLLYDNVH